MVGANRHQPQLPASAGRCSIGVLNDVSRQFFDYVGDTNREKLHNRRIAYAFSNPIVDPAGTHDPFWYHIEKFYGSSDHQVHLDWDPRIPAVQFGNWPDAVYHSSDDSPANQDPTQMKRSAFLMVTIGSTIANAGPADAVAISQVASAARSASPRISALVSISTSTADTLNQNYKGSPQRGTQAYVRERAEVRSATTLTAGDKDAAASIASFEQALGQSEPLDTARVKMSYKMAAARLKVAVVETPTLTDEEQAAARLIPSKKPGVEAPPFGPRIVPGAAPPPLTGYYAMEARNFADGRHSILDVRNAIAAEFGPMALSNVVQFFRDAEKAGTFTIAEKPAKAGGQEERR